MNLNNLFRYGHPMLSNFKRFQENEIVVPGGLICASSHAASSGHLYEVLHEEVVSCSFNERVSPLDPIGAVSFVRDIRTLSDDGLEEVTVKTIGLKNVDVTRELANKPLPLELFTEDPSALIGSKLDDLLEKAPALKGRVVSQSLRKLVRQSPYAHAKNVPLL